ncbi:heterokaryon incompatibility protein-domain-containing protein [Xylaria cf. heliscus]|nr:heterokaryon incompatibility protein-domain-containing protein [Xylaria cf. heliscus]
MPYHESFRAAGPKDVAGIIQFIMGGGLPDTRWSMSELQILRGYVSAWPHWNTPLHRMIATKQRDGINYLLEHGAGIHFLNSLGRTPLQEAARLGYYEGVELLLTYGADPNMPSQGRTAGHQIGDHKELADKDEYVLPIHEALRNGDTRMVRILARAGADINQPSEGWMPLDQALIDRQVNIMNVLFELGASFSPVKETINYDQDNREEAAHALLLAASQSDWFPPRSCHSFFIFVLATCNIDRYTTIGTSRRQSIKSDKLIRKFFKAVSSIAQRPNIEPAEDSICSLCFQYQTLSTYTSCSCVGDGACKTSANCFRHHENLENLVSSARSGCRLCRLFLQALNVVKSHSPHIAYALSKYQDPPTPHVYLHLHLPDKIHVTVGELAAELGLGYLNERTIQQLPSIDDYENGTSSVSTFQVAKAWLHNCITSHEACDQGHASTILPTRVVDVGDATHDPFLFESNGACHSYCALSYCWGTSSNAHKTTTKNLQRYYAAIPPHELPRTLHDAIHVARGLGFKYLWIDALCIIQDDNDDWLREAVKMTQVYANATLTITTSVGSSSDDGLFRSHPHGFFNPQQLHIRLPKRDRVREILPVRDSDLSAVRPTRPLSYLAAYPDANFPFMGVTGSPIETRAWTLQEQLLSKRILYYGDGVILWECLDATASEHDPDGRRGAIQLPDSMGAKRYFHSHMNSQSRDTNSSTPRVASASEKLTVDEHFAAYCRLLRTYGNRLVTKPSDRITAILGLGQVIQEASGNEFIGGIWKGAYSLASLVWFVEMPSPNGRTSKFPTWSWASMLPDPETHVSNNIGEAEVPIQWTAEVISFDVQSDLAQTEVKGSVTLRGRLGKLKDDKSYMMSLEGALRTTPHVSVDLDSDKDAPQNDPASIWCFEMATLSGDEELPSKVCLLLRQVNTDSLTFKRLGIYQHIIGEHINNVQTVALI